MSNEQPATEQPERTCPRCNSTRWVPVSLDTGWTRRAQCVPCGAIHPGTIGPGWKTEMFL
jgi:transcription elongation factor Elf1